MAVFITRLLATALLLASPLAQALDHRHGAWTALLQRHVHTSPDGNASRIRYASLLADRRQLKAYLDSLSAVSETDYHRWSKPQRLAFLINAYNAFTIDLVLSKYPDLSSIKDLGSVFQSPWKKKFIPLLGQRRSLDDLEHGLIRAPGTFDEPRVHVALVCASIGCPMLQPDAYTAEHLEQQLDAGMRSFLSDRSRNRYDPASGQPRVSKIFDWYGQDFAQGHQGFTSLQATFSRYAEQLADAPEALARLRTGRYQLKFLDYDWRLNDADR